jgi:hypothetical protein
MSKKITVSQTDLNEILEWLSELDTASSYEGFTFTKWSLQKPVDALARLRGHKSGD